MKTTLLVALTSIAPLCWVSAQSSDYTSAMKTNIAILDTTRNYSICMQSAKTFEGLATSRKTDWLPYYYAALADIKTAAISKDTKAIDPLIDKADHCLKIADSLSPKNSEIVALQGLSIETKIKVDPMGRGAEYGPMASDDFSKAMSLDPSNPRPYYLMGQSLLYTPEEYGGGKAAAKSLFQQAIKKYDVFKPATELSPTWGLKRTQLLLQMCDK